MDGLECLAHTVYYEARGESRAGQEAVAYVVKNRSAARKKSLCEVVYEGCQFSWTCKARKAPYGNSWVAAMDVAKTVLRERNDPTGGAQYFHSVKVKPSWSRKFTLTIQIGRHLFYK